MNTSEEAPPQLSVAPLVGLQTASQMLARAQMDEDEILARLQEQVRSLLPPSRVHVLLFFGAEARLYAWNRHGEAFPPSYFDTPAGQGIAGWMRETKESLLVGDFQRDWEHLPARPTYHNPDPPRSAIFVPLVVGDEALGTLSVRSNEADVYSPDHLWQLKILGNQAAAAIQAGRLLRSEKWRASQLQTLAAITRSVVSILNLDELLSHTVDVIQEALNYYHVQVFVIEPGADRAIFRASSDRATHESWLKIGRTVHIGAEGMIGWVAAHGEPLVAPDVSVDPLYIPDDPRLLPNTRSEIAVPLRLESETLGVLDVQSEQADAFGPDDLFILTAVADAVALAIANARLYARVQEDAWITAALLSVAEATNRLTELTEVVETIARITPLLSGVAATAIWLRDEAAADAYHAAGQWGIPDEIVRLFFKTPLRLAENPALVRLESEQTPLVLRQPQLDDLLAPIVAQTLLADAVILLPLLAKGEAIGVLAVSIDETAGPPSETRIPLLKGIADQSASAIQNAQLIVAQREEAWVSTALLQVAEAVGRAHDLTETLDIVARLTAALSGLDRCTILLRRSLLAGRSEAPGAAGDEFVVAISHSLRRGLPPLALPYPLQPANVPFLARLLAQQSPLVLTDLSQNDLLPPDLAAALSTSALAAVPLVANNEWVGILVVDEAARQRAHHPRLLDILGGIANQAMVAVERARLRQSEIAQQRLATELALAHDIQRGFLPESLPQAPGYEIAALWEPARQIGGDFYDVIPLPGGRLGLVVADVADKGIPAALYMALSRTTMRLVVAERVERQSSPAAALRRVNTAILNTTYSDMFVTIYYALLDPATHQVTYASAGHGLALHAHSDDVSFLRGRGSALGIFDAVQIAQETVALAPGDYLILYTDGVTDAVNPVFEEFGEDRLVDCVRRRFGIPADAMLDAIVSAVHAWEADSPPFDDLTLLVVRRQAC
jgi:serine phosphatase RsbU (regulator of sigma subunit)/putative methionine-R-sulfoxide reductase with GAF domain